MADRLSAQIAMASAAGMSYGKWKVLHPESEHADESVKQKKQEEQEKLRPCKRCGKPIPRTIGSKRDRYSKKLYCSRSCLLEVYYERNGRQKYKERKEKEDKKPGKCQWCDKQIPVKDDKGRRIRHDAKFCSARCREASAYKRLKEGATDG